MSESKSVAGPVIALLEKAEDFQTFLRIACIYVYANLALVVITKHQIYELSTKEIQEITLAQIFFIICGYFLFMGYVGRLAQITIETLGKLARIYAPDLLKLNEDYTQRYKKNKIISDRLFQYSIETGDYKPYEWRSERLKENRELIQDISDIKYKVLCLLILISTNYLISDRFAILDPNLLSIDHQSWLLYPIAILWAVLQFSDVKDAEDFYHPQLENFLEKKYGKEAFPMKKPFNTESNQNPSDLY